MRSSNRRSITSFEKKNKVDLKITYLTAIWDRIDVRCVKRILLRSLTHWHCHFLLTLASSHFLFDDTIKQKILSIIVFWTQTAWFTLKAVYLWSIVAFCMRIYRNSISVLRGTLDIMQVFKIHLGKRLKILNDWWQGKGRDQHIF